MSRIIVKNLPKSINETELKKLFEEKGTVTECSLKYTTDGKFRGFAFVGFKEEKEASTALSFFNNSFIKATKIQVSLSDDFKCNKRNVTKLKAKTNKATSVSDDQNKFCIQMSNVHGEITKIIIEEFFKPLSVIINDDDLKASKGKLYVFFNNQKDKEDALKRNKSYIGSKKVFLKDIKHIVDTVVQKENKTHQTSSNDANLIAETGRLFVRNLPYCCTEKDLEKVFSKYGQLTVQLPIDRFTKKLKGFAFISYVLPENAIEAFKQLDGTIFQGRMLHIVGGQAEKSENIDLLPFLKKKEKLKKLSASSSHNWNTLFVGGDAVANLMSDKYSTSKKDLLLEDGQQSVAVRMALGQTQIVHEIRSFLLQNGVQLESFSQVKQERSKSVIIAKDLPIHTTAEHLKDLFGKYGTIQKLLLPPSSVTAIIQFQHDSEAQDAFKSLAYTKFQHLPLYLEWAPANVFIAQPFNHNKNEKEIIDSKLNDNEEESDLNNGDNDNNDEEEDEDDDDDDDDFDLSEPRRTLFVGNLPEDILEKDLQETFSKYGKIIGIDIKKKKTGNSDNEMRSAFVEFGLASAALQCYDNSSNILIQNIKPTIKISDRLTKNSLTSQTTNKKTKSKSKPTKILVRNVPFQATIKDIKQLFSLDGGLKTARLPKKSNQDAGSHRGFAFVDFNLHSDAKRSFERLRHNTSLYGRRLNLEWVYQDPDKNEDGEAIDAGRKRTARKYHPDESTNKKKNLEL